MTHEEAAAAAEQIISAYEQTSFAQSMAPLYDALEDDDDDYLPGDAVYYFESTPEHRKK